MNELIECLHCREHFELVGMHICQKSKAQLCIGCATELRAERRANEKRRKREDIKERQALQRLEREAKNKSFADSLNDKTATKKTRRIKCNRMVEIDHLRLDKEIKDLECEL